ncbi:MAG: helix-turn-helix domain-containing protein [Bacteroidota bacterium]
MENDVRLKNTTDCDGLIREIGFQWIRIEDIFSLKNLPCGSPFVAHRIKYFTLLLVTEGEMVHEVDFTSYKIAKGDCLFISKEQVHKFDKSISSKGYVLNFSENFMLRNFSLSAFSKISFLSNYVLNPSLFKDFGDTELFITALERELSLELGKIKENLVAAMLTVFLLKAELHVGHALKSYHGDFGTFSRFQQLVSTNYRDSRSAKHYAHLLNISYKQLNNLSKVFTERTVKEYINNYIILEAKRSLVATNMPIKEIAYECGFKEATNFVKFFKRTTHDTPMKFREMRFGNP